MLALMLSVHSAGNYSNQGANLQLDLRGYPRKCKILAFFEGHFSFHIESFIFSCFEACTFSVFLGIVIVYLDYFVCFVYEDVPVSAPVLD